MKRKQSFLFTIVFVLVLLSPSAHAQYALSFNGTSNYAYYDAPFAATDIDHGTIEFWVKRTTSWGTILAKATDWSNTKYHIGMGDNNTGMFNQPTGAFYSVAYAPNQNEWGHVALVENDTDIKVYINGEYVGILPNGCVINAGYDNNYFIIGAASNSSRGDQEYFGGILDEIRIWNSVRTQTEIREAMNIEVPVGSTGLAGYFRMSDGSGTSLTDDKNTPNNTLTINGATWVTSTAPLGTGTSNTQTVSATGAVTFTGADVAMNFTAKSGSDDIVSTIINGLPNGTQPSGVTTVFPKYWVVRKYGSGTFTTNITFTVSGVSAEDQATPSNLKLFSRTSTSEGSWTEVASASSATATSITFNGITAFSQFAVGTVGNSLLPVELASFTAERSGAGVRLQWSTVTETNNYGFEVERKTLDNEQLTMNNWWKVGFVEGNGTTNAPRTYSFSDNYLLSGRYSYRLKQIDRDGQSAYSKTVEVTIVPPKEFSLHQNYPNPFNPSTEICYQLPITGHVSLRVFDAVGREVAVLVNEMKEAGIYSVRYDASHISNGVYFARLQSGGKQIMKKMLLMK